MITVYHNSTDITEYVTPPKTSGIYRILNTINFYSYIGSSTDMRRRRNDHFSKLRSNKHHSVHLQRAFNLYGEENFVFEVLIECHPDLRTWYEQQFLDQWKPEYNMYPTAIYCAERGEQTEETREKHRLAATGRKLSEEAKARISRLNTGRKWTDERKEKTMNTRAARGIPMPTTLGLKKSEEECKRISDRNKGRKHTEEEKAKISAASKGRRYISRVYEGFIDPSGIEHRNVFDLVTFCIEHGLSYPRMCFLDQGRQKTHRGWTRVAKVEENGNSDIS